MNNEYYEAIDEFTGKPVTRLHKHRENAYTEMLDFLGMSEEVYQASDTKHHIHVRGVFYD